MFTFIGDTTDTLKCGLHPFTIAYESDHHHEAMIANATAYSMISESTLGISLQDLEVLKSKDVKHIPLTYFMMESCLGSFRNLLNVMLGMDHEVTIAYQSFWELMVRLRIELNGKIGPGLERCS